MIGWLYGIVATIIGGAISFLFADSMRQKRELPEKYITKIEHNRDIDQIIDGFKRFEDRIESKMDSSHNRIYDKLEEIRKEVFNKN